MNMLNFLEYHDVSSTTVHIQALLSSCTFGLAIPDNKQKSSRSGSSAQIWLLKTTVSPDTIPVTCSMETFVQHLAAGRCI